MDKMNDLSAVQKQYATTNHLNTRISIHEKYSTNKMGFGNWITSNYRIEKGMKVLEFGCGTGEMWKKKESLLQLCSKIVLSDISEKMVDAARDNIGNYSNIEYKLIDIEQIPFENETFDIVIANMMLYHVRNMNKALEEVYRVLKRGGHFYCATYGEHGIMEHLLKLFSEYGVKDDMNRSFTLQNGTDILKNYFSKVEKLEYLDSLEVTHIDDMVEYIYSLSNMSILSKLPTQNVKDVLLHNSSNGILYIPKEYGMFIATKK